jgi:eukaryotic-like serine/threonine-protein kinase
VSPLMAGSKLLVGTIVAGRYQVGELIGESELSAVHSATDLRGSAQVALKVFDPAVKGRPAALSEYQAQARHASGLGVEGIARAYDFGIDANSGAPFSTAERIGWPSLERRVLAEGPLGVVELARGMTVLGRALDAAHATGLVHRDLKPQNVFISPDNPEWARITDFGVGALRRGAPEAMGWGGPPGYTPPEAVDAAAPAAPFADLFALGVLAFFALTRGTPFRSLRGHAFDPSAHWAELNQPLSPISERARELGVALDPSLDPWFARALALSPEQRFRTASDMARELVVISEQLGHRGAGPRSIPGIAVAIAQPLVFQPEPSPASLGLAHVPPTTNVSPEGVMPHGAPATASAALDPSAPRKKSLALPLMLGAGVLLLSGLAVGGYAVLSGRQAPPALSAAPDATPPSAPATAAPAPVAISAPPAVDPAPTPPASATAAATAAPLEEPVPTPPPKPAAVTPAKPAQASAKAATSAAAKPATSAAKPAATPVAKPAASTLAKAASTPAVSTKASSGAAKSTKKKCSAFLGCK